SAVVGPLMCERQPLHQRIHFAGGECHIVTDIKGNKHLREKMYRQGQQVAEVLPQLQRMPTELTEFHLMLVRRAIFTHIGKFDQGMLNTKEHLDFCLMVTQAGSQIYFEPASIATYVQTSTLDWSDFHFFMLRWSDAWTLSSLNHLRQKWNLSEDGYFKTKYQKLGWRRKSTIVIPLTKQLSFGNKNKPLKKIISKFERRLNHYLTNRYARKHLQPL
ncbi:MAG: glycosyltransferase family 2 protein, partial [Symploca sp. SIO1C4]|nr:glycosyltransferase family 2 protein [Symploca sp. SIO1C4]